VLDTWGSDLIVGLMAALLGGTLRIFAIVAPTSRPDRDGRRPGESFWSAAKRSAEEGESTASSLPRSAKLATVALYGLIAVIWISIAISPVEWRWIAFVIGTAIGYVVVELAFRAGRRTGGDQPSTGGHLAT
jgi:hypothetical protein